jgi:hypothetical protein
MTGGGGAAEMPGIGEGYEMAELAQRWQSYDRFFHFIYPE